MRQKTRAATAFDVPAAVAISLAVQTMISLFAASIPVLAPDIVAERGDAGIARIKELTAKVGADSVLECVGTKESMAQALECARPGSMIGYVGVPHGVTFDGQQLFFSQKGLMGGPAPVRRFLPHLMDLVLDRKINPGKVFDLELPLSDVSEGYRAMDERRAIKVLLRV